MVDALLIIDMLEDFVRGPLKTERALPIIPTIEQLADAARSQGLQVIYMNDAHLPVDFELARWGPHAMRGTPGAQVIPELRPRGGDLALEKRTYSSFYQTGLDDVLKKLEVKRILLTGLHTNICARHTAADAFFRGYQTTAVSDGLNAFSEKDHADGLEYLKFAYGADVTDAAALLKAWTGEAYRTPAQGRKVHGEEEPGVRPHVHA